MRDDDVKYFVSNQPLPNEVVGNYHVSSSDWKSNIEVVLEQAGLGLNIILGTGSGKNNSNELDKPIGIFEPEKRCFYKDGIAPYNFLNGKVEEKFYEI